MDGDVEPMDEDAHEQRVRPRVWFITDLAYGHGDAGAVPEEWEVCLLVREYRDHFCHNPPTVKGVLEWIFTLLGLPSRGDVDWAAIDIRINKEAYRFSRLKRLVKLYSLDDTEEDIGNMMRQIDAMRHTIRETLLANFMCVARIQGATHRHVPVDVVQEEDGDVLTLSNCDLSKLTSFQSVFVKIQSVLAACDLRRASGHFFERVVTQSGIGTQTFRPLMDIKTFVNLHTRIEDNFVAWQEVTQTSAVYPQLIDYLTTRPLSEASDLEENVHLRSYEGDRYGRFAVIYDCAQDMAWPLIDRTNWNTMADAVNTVRTHIYGKENFVSCVPPDPADVCIKHMMAEFPFDTYLEALEVDCAFIGTCWRECEEFECRHGAQYELTSPTLRRLMHERFPLPEAGESDMEPEMWGRTWQPAACGSEIDKLVDFKPCADVLDCVRKRLPVDAKFLEGCRRNSKITMENNDPPVFVPLVTPPRRRRAQLTRDEYDEVVRECSEMLLWCRNKVTHLHYVRLPVTGLEWYHVGMSRPTNGVELKNEALARMLSTSLRLTQEQWDALRVVVLGTVDLHQDHYVELPTGGYMQPRQRMFRPHVGRTWRDCLVAQVEQVYLCQDFTPHDRFMIYALKGRTLLRVGEFDRSQMTLFIEGTGGCGKSTLMRLMQLFWSHHRMGVLSSNIEAKFGMSQVMRGSQPSLKPGDFPISIACAIFCNEVSEDLNLVQEEWQTSCSGELGSYAVKNKVPLECVCAAQHFWVGNQFPKHWKNDQLQVSRRLAAVRMLNPVEPRKERIFDEMERRIGTVQRGIVLAYREFVAQNEDIDPMSVLSKLPPAFRDYFERGLRLTKPVEAVLQDDSYVRVCEGGIILMKEFRAIVHRYCADYRIEKLVGWGEHLYSEAFRKRGIVARKVPRLEYEQNTYHNVEAITGLCKVIEEIAHP